MSEGSAASEPIGVLLVEDNVDHADLTRRGLDDPFDVVHVRTGSEALERIRRESFEVCLLDHRLPDREGISLVGELRGEGYDGLILLVTGAARDALVDRAFEAGADDYLVKGPSLMGRLADTLHAKLGVGRA